MPQRISCQNCGAVLYQDEELKSSEEVYQMYNGKCPECGRKLSLIPQNVEVTIAKNPDRRRLTEI